MTGIRKWVGIVASLAVAAFGLSASLSSAQAQVPSVAPEFYNSIRQAEGQGIRFCIWPTNSTAAYDRAVAEEIAATLLLRPTFVEIQAPRGGYPDEDFWNVMFIELTQNCSAMMGGILAPSTQLEDWLTITQPYLSAPYVAVSGDEGLSRLGDLPARGLFGTPYESSADLVALNYLQTLPSDQRWRRLPYDDPGLMIDHLEQGTLQAGLVWQPMLTFYRPEGMEAAGLREISISPLQPVRRELGILLRSDDTALRASLDEAIAFLWEDGTLESLAMEHGFTNQR